MRNSKAKTILLIDDERTLLFGLSVMVKRAGYNVLTANNGKDGLRLATEQSPDLIISDVMMPPPNGFELREILSQHPSTAAIPFIFLTARSSQNDKLYGLESGADDYITKPFERKELLMRMKVLLRRVELERQKERAHVQHETKQLEQYALKNMTHELRTPLALVLQTLQMAKMERFKDNPQELQEFIERAHKNAEYLQTRVNDLLTLTRLDQGQVDNLRQLIDLKTDFVPLVDKCRERWQRHNLTIQLSVEPTVVIHAPKNGFKQTIEHLLDNACKFSRENGLVNIYMAENGQGGCILTITNQGEGIPAELREKVFERFYQISQGDGRHYDGLGLGLTIARAFARGLGGDVVILDSKSHCWLKMTIPPAKVDWKSI
jgi:two-component system sensor histidine kinase/response regulator